jgi:tetratricopeptide (TPR) repeat protein
MGVYAFVGREQELAQLHGYFDQALGGNGQICFVTGRAGSGKTALVRHFVEAAFARDKEVVLAVGSCNAQIGLGDPYLPFREALAMLAGDVSPKQSTVGITPENSQRLRTVLVRSVQVLVDITPELLNVFIPAGELLGKLGKSVADKVGWMERLELLSKRRALAAGAAEAVSDQGRIIEQYTAFLKELSATVPLILFLDDLQWADSASVNLLFHLGRHLESSRILVVGAYRADDVALGRGGERHPLVSAVNELTRYQGDVHIDLDGLPTAVNRRFVDDLLDSEPNALGQAFRQALFHKTAGHALFTAELVRAMQERGDLIRDEQGRWIEGTALDWGALPARVEGVVEERVGRLRAGLRRMLQVASIEGETFTAEVVARVEGLPEREAIRKLGRELERQHRLVSAEGLIRLGRSRLSRYRFAHNLFQQYLYGSLSQAERAYLHLDVGEALEVLLGLHAPEMAAQLARHFEEASVPVKAAQYLLQAGERARRMAAHQEAMEHLERGQRLAAGLPAGPERTRLQLDLQISLAMTLVAMQGYASPAVDPAFARARELARTLEDPTRLVHVLLGQMVFHLMRGDLQHVAAEGDEVLGLVQGLGDEGYLLTCHALLGVAFLYLGQHGRARQHLEATTSLYDPDRHGELAFQHGQDPGVAAWSFLARVLWLQGYPKEALACSESALKVATEIDHLYSQTIASLHIATLRAFLRQWPECQSMAEQARDLARRGGFGMWHANAAILRGTALAHQGRVEEGLRELTQAQYLWQATGAGLVAYGASCLADAYRLAGRREEGILALDESLYHSEEAWWQPEQYRLKAELLLLAPGDEPEAERLLQQALTQAREQGARALELRAATSLARLLRSQGRSVQARAQLVESCDGHCDGLYIPDCRDARRLLRELEGNLQPVAAGRG